MASGAWSRAPDANTGAKISGMYVYVAEGTAQAETGWALYTDGAITLGTTALTYGQTYGPGSVRAGDGLTRNLNELAVNPAVYPRGATAGAADANLWVYDLGSGGWLPKSRAGAGVAERNTSRGATAPASPVAGQLWLDTATSPPTLREWSGTAWQAVGGGGSTTLVTCELTRSTVQSIPNITWTPINFDVETTDTENWHSITSNLHLVTPGAGRYLINGYMRWAPNSTGNRFIRLIKNGAEVFQPTGVQASVFGQGAGSLHWAISMAAADTLHLEVNQSSGANLDLLADAKLNVWKLG